MSTAKEDMRQAFKRRLNDGKWSMAARGAYARGLLERLFWPEEYGQVVSREYRRTIDRLIAQYLSGEEEARG